MLNKALFKRKKNKIKRFDNGDVQVFDSINKAKKYSTLLQKKHGHGSLISFDS